MFTRLDRELPLDCDGGGRGRNELTIVMARLADCQRLATAPESTSTISEISLDIKS